MASNMEWSPDFCLSCDRQIAEGGAYCSQACRLADLEKAGTTEPQTHSQLSSSASSSGSTNGFYLPPAVNFSAYKSTSPSRGFDMGPSASYYQHSTTYGSYYAYPTTSTTSRQYQQRSLTPSSSRSSLASSVSQSTAGISAQAANQLSNYSRAFDQVREMRRRLT